MTTEMFIGGLMILTVAVIVVVAMTSSQNTSSDIFDWLKSEKGSAPSENSSEGD